MVLLELYWEAGESRASSLLPWLCMGAPGVYIGLPPGGTMVIWLGAGPSRLSLMPLSFPPASRARRLVGPADRPDTMRHS